MRKVHEKSIVLGIGIGMIITAIAGLIYSGGNQNGLTKDEIISKAKEYGMTEQTQNKNNDKSLILGSDTASTSSETAQQSQSTQTQAAQSTAAQTTSTAQTTAQPQVNENADRTIIVEIKGGDDSAAVSNQLLEKGVITSVKDFNDRLDSYNASTKINYGKYNFKKNEDLDYVVKAICKIK